MKSKRMVSINEVISILDKAAKEEGEEIKNGIHSDVKQLKGFLSNVTPEIISSIKDVKLKVMDGITDTKEKVVDISKKTVKSIDQSAHERPWYFVAAAVVPAMFLGHWIGRKNHH